MATRGARVVRGLLASSIAVFVAALAHVAGGGTAPGAAGVAVAFAFCALASIALAGRRVSRIRLAATVILSQGVFHLLFLVSGGSAISAPSAPGMDMGTSSIVGTSGPAMVEDGWMWIAHGIAAVVTIVALAWGERAFWMLFALVVRATGVIAVVVPPEWRLDPPTRFLRVVVAEFLVGSQRRRGPPRPVASA
jgi:hypothetical protein